MAKYSDDAKYVSAYNKAVASAKAAQALLAKLNSTKPDTMGHVTLKAQYDAAKKVADKDEAARLARKKEIDDAVGKEKEKKDSAKTKTEAQADVRQLEYERQLAINSGDKAAQAKAEADLKAAKDKAAGIKPPAPGTEGSTEGSAQEEVANNKYKDYTVNSNGTVTNKNGNVTWFISVKNPDGTSTMQEYTSAASARDAFLKNYSAPGALDKLKQQLRAKNYISKSELASGNWISGVDDMLSDYTRDAVNAVKYGGAKFSPLIDSWFAKAVGGLGDSGSTSKAGTWTDTDLDFTTVGDANKEINDYILDALGREATQEEKDAYYKDINEREKKSAIKTVSVRDATGKITNTTRTGDFVTPEERLNSQLAIVAKALKNILPENASKLGGKVAKQLSDIKIYAADYGVKIDGKQALDYVLNSINTGGDLSASSIETQKNTIRELSKAFYSNLAPLIDNGVKISDIGKQFGTYKGKILELPDEAVDIFDEDIQTALRNDGKPGVMSLTDYQIKLRNDPRWSKTQNAREEAATYAESILKSFGLMG